ncbi:Nudix (Nucleoside diphosphate linked moiety X)-type motif 1 [Coemansia sp. IMI 209127]|nr:Nudix (Nucleoside diphosphate linked moiety X)-type motif 1 [Coemansia sp. IMI 209127]
MSQKYYTLIFPFSETGDRVLLGRKKRGVGKGLWNGFGGKLERHESVEECAIRELHEECGLKANRMEYIGVLYMNCTSGVGNTVIFVYRTDAYAGDIAESDEMHPLWFDVGGIPYSEMYEEAALWWPMLLDKNRPLFVASFMFDRDDLGRRRG